MAYISLNDLKTYLRIDEDDENTRLQTSIDAAQARVDAITHRTFEASTDTSRYFDLFQDVSGRTVYFDNDLYQVTLVENQGVVIPATDYILEPRNDKPHYALTLRLSTGKTWDYGTGPEDAIKITGRWAYSITAPEPIRRATFRLAAFYFHEADSDMFETIGPEDQGEMTLPKAEPLSITAILRTFIRPASVRRCLNH